LPNEEYDLMSKQMLQPGIDHPITITPTSGRVTVTLDGTVIADSRAALTLQESNYRAVQYIPRADVDMSLLERTDHTTYCPYKGECNYFSIAPGGERTVNAVWTYERPYTAVAAIEGHLAFYPDRVEITVHPD
jgi:uncharacterized protein (DUF427 family)